MKLKPVGLLTLVVWGIVSVLWIGRSIYNAVSGMEGTPWFNVLLAAIWFASFCVMLYRYWKGRKGKE